MKSTPAALALCCALAWVSLASCRTAPVDVRADPGTQPPARIVDRGSGLAFVLVPAGDFWMGSPEGEPDRDSGEARHRRTIREPFYLGETEVTVAQFRRFVDASGYRTDAE